MNSVKPVEFFVPVTHERCQRGASIKAVRTPVAEKSPAARPNADTQREVLGSKFLVGYAPGLQEQRFSAGVESAGKLIPAASDIILQLHYTPSGKASSDKTRIGLTLATETPKYRYLTLSAASQTLEIPPNEGNYESHSSITLNEPAQLVWLMPPMHVRGKDFIYKAVYPTANKRPCPLLVISK